MKRRNYLGVTSTVLLAGCLSSSDEPSSGPTETATPSTSKRTPQEQTHSPETETPQSTQTPTPPYTFVSVGNNHDSSHRIRVTITSVATGETLAEEERQMEPGRENRFKISDEWLTEEGGYEVNTKTDDGRSTSIKVEADESWACNHTVAVEITSDGQLISNLTAGMRKGC